MWIKRSQRLGRAVRRAVTRLKPDDMQGPITASLIQISCAVMSWIYAEFSACKRKQLKRKSMEVNEGVIDRSLRVAAGLVLIGLAATGTVGVWGYIGLVPLLTGAIGVCPLYSLLGINSRATPRR